MAQVSSKSFYRPTRHFYQLIILLAISSCTAGKKVYVSDCDMQQTFKRVTFAHLLDSIGYYDQQYVEVTGKYLEGKKKSALYNDSTYIHLNSKALWVNFSQDCPLYLSGTQKGLFEDSDGAFTSISNKKMRIRGRIDVHNKGALKQYKGCIDRVSLIELY